MRPLNAMVIDGLQMAEDALQLMAQALGDTEVLVQILNLVQPSRGASTLSPLMQDGSTADAPASDTLVTSLLGALAPSSGRVVYGPWAQLISGLRNTDQVASLRPLVSKAPGMALLVRQEAFRTLCICLAQQPVPEVAADTSLPIKPSQGEKHQQTSKMLQALKLVYCFNNSGGPDVTSEAAILIDVALKLSPGSQPPSDEALQALTWAFRCLHGIVSDKGSCQEAETSNVKAKEAAGKLILRFLARSLPYPVMQCTSIATISAALQTLCACKGGSGHAHRLLRHLETELSLHKAGAEHFIKACSGEVTITGQIQTASCASVLQHPDSSRLFAVYLTLLGHMCGLYEIEKSDFVARLQAANAGAPGANLGSSEKQEPGPDAAAGAALPGQTAKGRGAQSPAASAGDASSKALGKGPASMAGEDEDGDSFDYMQKEEAAIAQRALTQHFLHGLMQHTAPACKAPVLVAVLEDSSGEIPVGVQVLALRALGRLMALSDEVATLNAGVLARCLMAALNQWPASCGTTSPAAAADAASKARKQPCDAALLTVAALQITEVLVCESPNVNSSLVASIQQLICSLANASTAASEAAEKMISHHQQKEGGDRDGNTCSHQNTAQLDQLLLQASVSYARILGSEKLRMHGSAWGLLSRLALLPGMPQVKRAHLILHHQHKGSHPEADTCFILCVWWPHTPPRYTSSFFHFFIFSFFKCGYTCVACDTMSCEFVWMQVRGVARHLLVTLLAAPGTLSGAPNPSIRARRAKGALALFGNCAPALRLQLVQEVRNRVRSCKTEILQDTSLSQGAPISMPAISANHSVNTCFSTTSPA